MSAESHLAVVDNVVRVVGKLTHCWGTDKAGPGLLHKKPGLD